MILSELIKIEIEILFSLFAPYYKFVIHLAWILTGRIIVELEVHFVVCDQVVLYIPNFKSQYTLSKMRQIGTLPKQAHTPPVLYQHDIYFNNVLLASVLYKKRPILLCWYMTLTPMASSTIDSTCGMHHLHTHQAYNGRIMAQYDPLNYILHSISIGTSVWNWYIVE